MALRTNQVLKIEQWNSKLTKWLLPTRVCFSGYGVEQVWPEMEAKIKKITENRAASASQSVSPRTLSP